MTHFRERQLTFGDITMTAIVEKPIGRVTAAEIRAAFVIERSKIKEERSYGYGHWKTGRQFAVRRCEYRRSKSRFFLCEMRPNGRMMEVSDQGEVVRAWDEPRIRKAESCVGPNELLAALRATGV